MSTIQLNIDAKKVVLDWMSANAFIPVNKSLMRKIGDTCSILLAETIRQYERWAQQNKIQEDGSFYWTQEDCEIETSYSRSTQQRTYEKLENLNLLKVDNHQIIDQGVKKSVRFIILDFVAIATLMFEDDTSIIESIKQKYSKKKIQNQESSKRRKEKSKEDAESAVKEAIEKQASKRAENLDMAGKVQNESSQGFKMNPRGDSKWVPSNKESLIINNSLIKNNLSIQEEINSSYLSDSIKSNLQTKIDRLIYHNLSILDILNNYEIHKESVTEGQYIRALLFGLKDNRRIEDFDNLMAKNINNIISFDSDKPAKQTAKATRKEMVPDWLDNQNQNDVGQEEDVNHEQLKEMAEWYKQGERNFSEETIAGMLQYGYLSAEDINS